MLSVMRIHLPSDIPIVGCELTPYIQVRRPDKSVTADDVPESAPIDGHFLSYKWYRIQTGKKEPVCCIHPLEKATLQCLACVKHKLPVAQSYHCTPKCFKDAWPYHRTLHEHATNAATVGTSASTTKYPTVINRSGGEIWFEVGQSKTYTPTAADTGHVLRFECAVVNAETKVPTGHPNSLLTSHVIPAPSPTPRRLVSINADGSKISSTGNFTVLSYNILSDAYVTNQLYSYCPPWALSWPYRRQNLLREIVGYQADVVCLQEVQSNHFEEFFGPELGKHGYEAFYKQRTTEALLRNRETIDGCATFFRRDKFKNVKKYEVEFNKAARSVVDAFVPADDKKSALTRLMNDNVTLILVLEAKFINQGVNEKRQLVCVANTHLNVHHGFKDVKLWQVHNLLKGLERIAANADLPMMLCGDFNLIPGSNPHTLLAMGKVDPMPPELVKFDPFGILPHIKLTHHLPLVSAYSSFSLGGPGLENHRRRMNPNTKEPLFTRITRDYIGTMDYIFYSADRLTVESLLELLDAENLRRDTALPSPLWSSDHIALMAEFRCKPQTGH